VSIDIVVVGGGVVVVGVGVSVVVIVEDSFAGALIVAVRSFMAGLLCSLQVASTD
jgi:hypothetical protein